MHRISLVIRAITRPALPREAILLCFIFVELASGLVGPATIAVLEQQIGQARRQTRAADFDFCHVSLRVVPPEAARLFRGFAPRSLTKTTYCAARRQQGTFD